MRLSIRKKLIFSISFLILLLFSLVSFLLINEKKMELADDIYMNSLAFSRMTAPDVVKDYELYLKQGAFVYFNRGLRSLLTQTDYISSVMVLNYDGEILYDSDKDVSKKYDGSSKREVTDENLLKSIRSEYVSIESLGEDTRLVFLDENVDGVGFSYLDYYGKSVEPFVSGTLVGRFVIPVGEKYFIVFKPNYEVLTLRVNVMIRRILYLALLGFLIGFIMAFGLSKQFTKPIHKLVYAVKKIAKGDFNVRVEVKTHDELEFLGDSFNQMAVDLKESVNAKLYKERVTRELQLAKHIQKRVVPKIVPVVEGLDISAGIVPAEEIGGDMYDFLLPDDNRFMVYLGDVTGHGVPAGIVSSISNALFYGFSGLSSLKDIVARVNAVLSVKTVRTMFMTLCLLEWNKKDRSLSYVSAGHERLFHYRADDDVVDLLPAGGVALGMIPNIENHIHLQNVDFRPGDFIILYSDGIPEAWNEDEKMYGFSRFKNLVKGFAKTATAEVMKKEILNDLKNFMGNHRQMDDITLVVLKRPN